MPESALREALNAAATSLETVARLSGREFYGNPPIESYMGTFEQVRGYATSRAAVARAALSAQPAPAEVAPDLTAIRSERRAIEFGDIVATHSIAMGAAIVEAELTSPAEGMKWIFNTLFGPGLLPDMDEARALGGAQAWFDAKMEEHEAFRRAHPAPALPRAKLAQAPAPSAQAPTLAPTGRAIDLGGRHG